MILRKPNFQDIYKASEFLSQDEEDKKQILLIWLEQTKNNPSFFSWVIVNDHAVHAVIMGWFKEGTAVLAKLEGKDSYQELLLNKLVKVYDPNKIKFTNEEFSNVLSRFGFTVESYNLEWNKSEIDEDITVEETDENNQSSEKTDTNQA